jgi:hypothetical protein
LGNVCFRPIADISGRYHPFGMTMRHAVVITTLLLAACQTAQAGSLGSQQKLYPIEYVAQDSTKPRPVLGFFREQVYQSYDNRAPSERTKTESRARLNVTLEDGAYVTDFVPIFVPSKAKTSVRRETFSCDAIDHRGAFLIDCTVHRSARHFKSAYQAGAGFLWFEGLCYPDNERMCRYVPVAPEKLLFSPRMAASLK